MARWWRIRQSWRVYTDRNFGWMLEGKDRNHGWMLESKDRNRGWIKVGISASHC